ncbi:MAG: bifunctional UDP-N-acetylglucosamine diphosphorylase/glucosamine-1-phosphate N-acetyltransferase GlmU [Bryobacteraceae bacterium]
MTRNVTIAILAAGLGTRMKSKKAKVLHRAGGFTLVEHVIRAAQKVAEPDDIVTVVGHQADQVRATVAHMGVRFAEQTEQKGTGHALSMCRPALEGSGELLIVLYGDGPLLRGQTLETLVARHRASGAAATVVTTILDDPSGYGRIVRDSAGNVQAIVEQKAASEEQKAIREINSGLYCFNAELVWKHIGEIGPNPASGEYYLTDIVEILRGHGHVVAPMLVEDSAELLGINTRVELAQVDRIFRERKVQELMLSGVTIERPETVTVDPDVIIGRDTVVGPFCQILGRTVIGEDCMVGAGSIIKDSTIEDAVMIDAYTLVGTSHVERDAHLGPFSRLRMENRVEQGAHIGNFVELKKTRLGRGSKSMHLAYLGDSDIGSKVNVGAGTITCNYDGTKKHQTKIGAGAFVGSNSTLVAPVEVGDESYIAAGSVITDAVPGDALALGRARQVVKEGWPSKRKMAASRK